MSEMEKKSYNETTKDAILTWGKFEAHVNLGSGKAEYFVGNELDFPKHRLIRDKEFIDRALKVVNPPSKELVTNDEAFKEKLRKWEEQPEMKREMIWPDHASRQNEKTFGFGTWKFVKGIDPQPDFLTDKGIIRR